jgi:hypothetical protein
MTEMIIGDRCRSPTIADHGCAAGIMFPKCNVEPRPRAKKIELLLPLPHRSSRFSAKQSKRLVDGGPAEHGSTKCSTLCAITSIRNRIASLCIDGLQIIRINTLPNVSNLNTEQENT